MTLLLITEPPPAAIRSFIVVLYNGRLEDVGRFHVPVAVAAPFANRLFESVLPGRQLREPWYSLLPQYGEGAAFKRAPYPVGLTSLTSTRYAPEEEPPPRVTLHPRAALRSFTVRLLDYQTELYKGDYSVDDIFLAGAEFLARGRVADGALTLEDGPFYYAIIASPEEVRTAPRGLFPPEAYQVEGVFQLPLLAEDRPRTVFRRVAPEPLPERDPATLPPTQTLGSGEPGAGRVLFHAEVYAALQAGLELSARTEDGGYLLGAPYRQPGSPSDDTDPDFRWWLEVSDVVLAEGAWAQAALLLFTGETWSRIARRLDQEPDKKLVAWFHTHLFAATDTFGLSGMDLDLHRRYLTKPWQVAVLLNVEADGARTVRCYQRGPEGDLVECPFEVLPPREIEVDHDPTD